MSDTASYSDEEMIDLAFPIKGQAIADDHALLLARALIALLPWWEDEAEAGILPIAGLSRSDGMCYVGGRARLTIRLPQRRVASADFLQGAVLDIGGEIELGRAQIKPLASAKVVHSPCVDLGTPDEGEFQANCLGLLQARGMFPELVCGRVRQIQGPRGTIRGYSLMLYGLKPEQTLSLQYQGLGFNRHLGCGIFVPHKNVAAVISDS
jgi:CRISPR-associated protein Cas6